MAKWNRTQEPAVKKVIETLCSTESYRQVSHRSDYDVPVPSPAVLGDMVQTVRAILFPDYFGPPELRPELMNDYVETSLNRVLEQLKEQINRGLCFSSESNWVQYKECREIANELALKMLSSLPRIRHLLSTDVDAAYKGDPAAKSPAETIICYPSVRALTNYRIAHELYRLGVPIIPRIVTEMAHSETGIDIHPGAEIGGHFFMDHGTGIVIGETCVIGRNVKIYQGVTLGAKNFPLDENGNPIKGIPRHPIVEDNVIIYSGATILGRIRIGRDSVIGGNVWLTRDVGPGSRIVQARVEENVFESGAGI